jgi:hypothetical protein
VPPHEEIQIAANQHIGYGVEIIKLNVETSLELTIPIRLKRLLVAWQKSSDRICHKVEKQSCSLLAVAKLIEMLQCENGILDHYMTKSLDINTSTAR